ncbi:hypothetical protein [Sagittula salina]|uniref:Uncharacterized protein n=1 Tax=Sagittula salina TaxID=2820268 RepID=A0A940S1F4_9RHOB|nr:hypothetical protein [Sagittula salina]MBP0483066.1 hypothetical protein [Sagittula salina]
MPINLTVHPHSCLAYYRLSGVLTVDDSARALRAWIDHPGFEPSHVMLIDMSTCDEIRVTFLGIVVAVERLLPVFDAFTRPALCVIHAPDDVAFGVARMLQQTVEPVSNICFEIHRDPPGALRAAGICLPTFDALDAGLGLSLPAVGFG